MPLTWLICRAMVTPKCRQAVKRQWGPMIETYLKQRESLQGVVLILDVRRTPAIEELNFIDWLERYDLPVILALTKTDKLSKNKLPQRRQLIAQALARDPGELILFSAKTRRGKSEVWGAIEQLLYVETQ